MAYRAPRLLALFAALAGASSLVILTLAVVHVDAVLAVALLSMATVVLEALPARAREDVQMSLASIVGFTALLLFGPWAIVMTTGAAGLYDAYLVRRELLLRGPVNVALQVLGGAAAALAFAGTGGTGLLQAADPAQGLPLLPLLAAGLAYPLVNAGLLTVVLRLAEGEPLRSNVGLVGQMLLGETVYLPIAVLAAVVQQTTGWTALLLLLVPLGVARRAILGFEALSASYDRFLRAFTKAIEVKDPYTRGHAERVGELSEATAAELGLPYEQRQIARFAALLHDLGKIGVPLDIINKPGPLTDNEFSVIKEHPRTGADVVDGVAFLDEAVDAIRYHHERLDGRGYPYRIGGEEIPLLARIITVVDAFDAMTSTRSYRAARPAESALRELRRCAGRQFDPVVVAAFERALDRLHWTPRVQQLATPPETRDEGVPLNGDDPVIRIHQLEDRASVDAHP